MKPKLVIFGGTGGLGQWITPLLAQDFEVQALGSANVRVDSYRDVKSFFDSEDYFPYVIYMAMRNWDGIIHKLSEITIKQLEPNIQGFINVLRHCLPAMREHKYGRIVYISSILSEKPIPGTGAYAATKAFNDNLVKTCALENAKYNITCNSLQLGYFDAGLTHKVPQSIMDKVIEKIPVGRLGHATDLERAIRFIFESPYLTGANIPYSGGLNLV